MTSKNLSTNWMALSIGCIWPLETSKPRNLILVWKSLIFLAETIRLLCLIISRKEFRCFQCSSMDLEKIRASSM
jgi:hypothetical protein